eukprot:CAMPEP_0203821952 /NCGR_PEP_ID=MMETSP0115-20131106/44817_1 /ASSEMBLY_ACC=CAM_ASM_000227 /TAXON_ID=33651 /ORGANISM="Bicosoecid sp, Strain ms1" /LENGTH=213 /DNA_ID=CAMNT_0050730983 /DNA_START=169 /DNA_END=807 /DNA_ORIENTATION=+
MVLLWLRDELFEHGVLHTVQRGRKKPTVEAVRALVAALRAADPEVASIATWTSLAEKHLHWTEAESRIAVELFRLFYRDGTDEASLPLPEFATFLFVQCYVRAMAESPVKSHAAASWPTPESAIGPGAMSSPGSAPLFSPGRSASSPRTPASPRALALQSRTTEQAHRLQFVKKHVEVLMELVTGAAAGSDDAADVELTAEAFDRLSLLINGG